MVKGDKVSVRTTPTTWEVGFIEGFYEGAEGTFDAGVLVGSNRVLLADLDEVTPLAEVPEDEVAEYLAHDAE